MKSPHVSSLILTLSLLAPLTSQALPGNEGSGGGHSMEQILLDRWENKRVAVRNGKKQLLPIHQLDPMTVPGVKEAIQKLGDRVPRLARALKGTLSKTWYLDPKPLGECKGGETLLDARTKVTRGCQNRIEVRLDEEWFFQNPFGQDDGNQNRKCTILHEMARAVPYAIAIADKDELQREKEAALHALTRLLCEEENALPAEATLQARLDFLGFGKYGTAGEFRQAVALVETDRAKLIAVLDETDRVVSQLNRLKQDYEAAKKATHERRQTLFQMVRSYDTRKEDQRVEAEKTIAMLEAIPDASYPFTEVNQLRSRLQALSADLADFTRKEGYPSYLLEGLLNRDSSRLSGYGSIQDRLSWSELYTDFYALGNEIALALNRMGAPAKDAHFEPFRTDTLNTATTREALSIILPNLVVKLQRELAY